MEVATVAKSVGLILLAIGVTSPLVTAFLFFGIVLCVCVLRAWRGCAIVVLTDPRPGLSRASLVM